jgi:hypothetical protein
MGNTHIAPARTPIGCSILPIFNEPQAYPGPAYGATQGYALIGMDDDKSIVKIFCFDAFTEKTNGLMYHDLTGSFPFISLVKHVFHGI